jgi:hypothetical protein
VCVGLLGLVGGGDPTPSLYILINEFALTDLKHSQQMVYMVTDKKRKVFSANELIAVLHKQIFTFNLWVHKPCLEM